MSAHPEIRDSFHVNGYDHRPVLITGGCGFIGTNLADRFLCEGQRVILFDNLSRAGVEKNLRWLQNTHGPLVKVEIADIRNTQAVRKIVRNVSKVFHFAAQVAVTTSLNDPIEDFEINARGTLNLLEGLRSLTSPPPLLFTSSNKVYGDLSDVKLNVAGSRCHPIDRQTCSYGFDESRPLDFHSPYGCSKGAGGQYVLDYARTFGISALVFHMSCIYGRHQFGNEDQGWIAHFLLRAINDLPITIYGNGKQVRDILFVDDLVNAFLLAMQNMHRLSGTSFNIGGGPQNTISLSELLDQIKRLHGRAPEIQFENMRLADQAYYVSDIRKFSNATGWAPTIGSREGIAKLYAWLLEHNRGKVTDRKLSKRRSIVSNDEDRVPFRGNEEQVLNMEPRSKRIWHGK